MKQLTIKPFLLLFIAIFLAATACQKTEKIQHDKIKSTNLLEDKFFNSHRTANPNEKIIIEFIKRKNDKDDFVEKAIKQIGYPLWDKVLTIKKADKRNSARGSEQDSLSVFYIPFVRDRQHYVNASLVVSTQKNDTTLTFVCDWQYKNKVHGSTNSDTTAERIALFFMTMDNHTFGYNEFNLTDTRLFPKAKHRNGNGKKFGFLNNSSSSQRQFNRLENYEICIDYYVCGDPDWCAAHGGCDYGHCAAEEGEEGYCYLESTNCEEIWIPTGGGSGGSGNSGGGEGGGSGGGGGTEIPECEDPDAECGPGWDPSGGSGLYEVVANQLNSILAPDDYFYFVSNLNPNQSLIFTHVTDFQNYLNENENNYLIDLTGSPTIINQDERIEYGKISFGFGGGVEVGVKVTKTGNLWSVIEVTSTDYGLTLSWSWQHDHYAQSTNGNEITIDVYGYIKYNIFVEGIGTVYKSKRHYRLKVDKTTGKITSISKI